MAEGEPVRVLDLLCGSGRVRITAAARYPNRTIHYVGIDEEPRPRELADHKALIGELFRNVPHREKTDEWFREKVRDLGERLIAQFRVAHLNLREPERLAGQLREKLGEQRFDEIHLHMPYEENHPRGVETLKVIGAYLKHNGRLYHLFVDQSPLLDFQLGSTWLMNEKEAHALHPSNEGKIRRAAERAGLRLVRYGLNAAGGWHTASSLGTERKHKITRLYAYLAGIHSAFSEFADNFVILRRPKR